MTQIEQADVQNLYDQRLKRVRDAVAFKEPDHVPWIPVVGYFYANAYGLSPRKAMEDPSLLMPNVRSFLEEYYPDLMMPPVCPSIDGLEKAGSMFIEFPEPGADGSNENGHQQLDADYMEEEEYEEFINNCGQFLLTKVGPRRYQALKGLEAFSILSLCQINNSALAAMANPEVAEALTCMLESAQLMARDLQKSLEAVRIAAELGFPLISGVLGHPYDNFASSVRGFVNTLMDMYSCPEDLSKSIDLYGEMMWPQLEGMAKANAGGFAFFPLTSPGDKFMSPENFDKFYWPWLKRIVEMAAENDVTPILVFEGNCDTRVERLMELPPQKTIVQFESADLARAKRMLHGIACVAGGMDNSLLIRGTPDEVYDKTQRLLDELAPGGGYIMSASMELENARHENMKMWRETTWAWH